MNNLQIAIGRITRGIDWFKAFLVRFILQIINKKPKDNEDGSNEDEDPKTEGIEMNHFDSSQHFKMADGIPNCLVECGPSGLIVDGGFSLNVPIAQGESDFENMDEDDTDDVDDTEDVDDADDSEFSDEEHNPHYSVSTVTFTHHTNKYKNDTQNDPFCLPEHAVLVFKMQCGM